MAKAAEKNAVATQDTGSNLPAHLQGGKTARIGNVDQSDRIIPRVKLMQGTSKELDNYNEAKKGQFWHNIACVNMGSTLRAIPIIMRKSYKLWSPRDDSRGVLARANDAVHWDLPEGTEFEVKPKNSPHKVKYILGLTTKSKGPNGEPALSEFGSSIPGDPNSPPAAALTYEFVWYFPEFHEISPAIVLNTRSSVKPAKDLISKIELRPVDHYAQVYNISSIKATNAANEEFYNYNYAANGYATEQEFKLCKDLFDNFSKINWATADESEDTDGDGLDSGSGGGARRSGKPLGEEIPF